MIYILHPIICGSRVALPKNQEKLYSLSHLKDGRSNILTSLRYIGCCTGKFHKDLARSIDQFALTKLCQLPYNAVAMPRWWNRLTRKFEGRVGFPVGFQIPPSAPYDKFKDKKGSGEPFFHYMALLCSPIAG